MKLIDPKKTIEVIQKNDFAFKKSFGQNFLVDSHVLDKIIDAADVGAEDFVLEVGPGIGTLTEALAEKAWKVVAVEIDQRLIPILTDNLSEYSNVEIVNGDILKVDIRKMLEEEAEGHPVKVVANLPYYITTPIIMELLEQHLAVDSITVMIQKEVAERMQAGPGTKDYGALSLAVQYYSKPYYAANVPPNSFIPRPKVGSAVIRLDVYETSPVSVKDEKLLFRVIKAAFGQRRKMLTNALSSDAGITKEQAADAIEKAGFAPTVRGEELSLSEFAHLADALKEII